MRLICSVFIVLFAVLAGMPVACAQEEDCYFLYTYSGSEAESIVGTAALKNAFFISSGDSSDLILLDEATDCVVRISTEACTHYTTVIEIQTAEKPGTPEWEIHNALFGEIFSILCDYCDLEQAMEDRVPDEHGIVYEYISDLTEFSVAYEQRGERYIVTIFKLLKPV